MPQPPTPTLLRTPAPGPRTHFDADRVGVQPRPKLKKLRLAVILLGLSVLALVSTVFGMMMAVAGDLPALENEAEFRSARNSVLQADDGRATEIAKLTGNQNRILVDEAEISPNIRNAVIAVEDRRFYDHEGVDYRGIARALWQDLRRQQAAQGGSTITQQFVKNALAAQGDRSVFQKLRESALAYHLEREWSKQKVLTQYLNSVYFGNGAYGIESAVRTYFRTGSAGAQAPGGAGQPAGAGKDPEADLDLRAARNVRPHEAALLAGMIASPTAYDPIQNPDASKERRNLVLHRMLEQDLITQGEHDVGVAADIPSGRQIDPPAPDSAQPYFSSWVTQQLVDDYGSGQVFGGGLKVKTTLDPELQGAAEEAIERRLGGVGPSSSLVAIENKTGEVKAMVGGGDFQRRPFNLATNGHRQPGSAFKPFTLIAALEQGVSPDRTFASQQKVFPVPGSPSEKFVVNNYEDKYSGVASLAAATSQSDNSVYAELGLQVGTKRIAKLAHRMGIRTELSTNPAMTLGGLEQGLTPLELAHAYSTIANRGVRVSGSLAASKSGPVAIERVEGAGSTDRNKKKTKRVFSEEVGEQAQQLLSGVVTGGTGSAAAIPGEFVAGKTGTTENYGDAWFVGFNEDYTVAVWVGYPDRLKYMKTEYRGSPVAGGTYPTEIWHDFMTAAIRITDARDAAKGKTDDEEEAPIAPVAPVAPVVPQPQQTVPQQPQQTVPQQQTAPQQAPQQPQQPQRAPAPRAAPQQTPQDPQSGPGGGATPGSG
jgi:penicillin-binding protein 1A